MTPNDIEKLGKLLSQFLDKFSDCFARPSGRRLLRTHVNGLLSDRQRKNAEAIALQQNVPSRTLQRFLECMVWDEQLLRDRCQQIVATEHACIFLAIGPVIPRAEKNIRARRGGISNQATDRAGSD